MLKHFCNYRSHCASSKKLHKLSYLIHNESFFYYSIFKLCQKVLYSIRYKNQSFLGNMYLPAYTYIFRTYERVLIFTVFRSLIFQVISEFQVWNVFQSTFRCFHLKQIGVKMFYWYIDSEKNAIWQNLITKKMQFFQV